MRYTLRDMQAQFPSNDKCLEMIFNSRYGQLPACPKCGVVSAKYYRVKGRMAFECKECRHQIYPLVGTIFQKTTTPLVYWFHAIYLFSVSKNGVSALELHRQIDVSYKTAHRMAKMIRLLMKESGKIGFLGTPVEADETYFGGRRKQSSSYDNKTPVIAALEVEGEVRTEVVTKAHSKTVVPFLVDNVERGSMLHTDESKIYKHHDIVDYFDHKSVRHVAKEFVGREGVTTNHVEGFFGNMKRAIDGTYHSVSPQYLHSYVSEFAFRYNHRDEVIFPLLVAEAVKPAL